MRLAERTRAKWTAEYLKLPYTRHVFEQSLTWDRAVSSEGEPSYERGRRFNPYIARAQIQLGVVGSARLLAGPSMCGRPKGGKPLSGTLC